MVCYFMPVSCAYSGSTLMATYNGVEKISKRRSKMMEKMTKRRSKKMDKETKKEAEPDWPAPSPA